jgi:hypothetical protein
VRYFQKSELDAAGSESRYGVFRRPFDDDHRADQLFQARSKSWVLDSSVHTAELGYRDGDFVEVDEAEARAFLARRYPELDVDAVLSEPPATLPPRDPGASYPARFAGGASYVPLELSGVVLGDLWWSDDDTAAGVEWRRVETRDQVPTAAMEWWSRRLRAAASEGLGPAALVAALADRPGDESGVLRRDLAGHVASIEELRERAGLA